MSEVIDRLHVTQPHALLSGAEVAQLLGIGTPTWRSYVLTGLAPQPDDRDDRRPDGSVKPVNLRRPRWRVSTVHAYVHDGRRNPRMRRGRVAS
jgi:hypothetical protein